MFVSFVALVIRFLIALLPFATNNTGFRNVPLEGAIPEEIGRLSALTSLDLAGTNLNGTLPDGLYDLTALTSLKISRIDGFQSSISTRIGMLSNLQVIEGANSNFSGQIPSEIGMLTKLEFFRMNSNKFTGNM